jgi:hypothetical protein
MFDNPQGQIGIVMNEVDIGPAQDPTAISTLGPVRMSIPLPLGRKPTAPRARHSPFDNFRVVVECPAVKVLGTLHKNISGF